MPVHIDEPAPGMAFDPREFRIRGWLWLKERHPALAAVEVFSGDTLLGRSDRFSVRPDVSAKYSLAADTPTAFDRSARYPEAPVGTPFDLQLHAVLRDGRRVGPIFTSRPAHCHPNAIRTRCCVRASRPMRSAWKSVCTTIPPPD